MTSNALTVLREAPKIDASPADIFFDKPLCSTDWNQVRHEIRCGVTRSSEVLDKIKAMEPMAEDDPRDFEHWRQQQILRLCLQHEAGKPLELETVCDCCGVNKCDPCHGRSDHWKEYCMDCAEQGKQVYNGGSRGSCEFVMPAYNPRSKCWGLLYYWSHGSDDNTFMFWMVDYYRTRQEAQAAIQPVKLYIDWLNIKYNGMIVHWIHFNTLIDLDDLMQMQLPMTPDQFRAILRSKIETGMVQEHDVMGYYVRDALSDHERKEKDE